MRYRKKYGSKRDYVDFLGLVAKVSKIDIEAADYLLSKKAVKFAGGCGFDYSGNLSQVIIFSSSPQGHYYWQKIKDALEPAK